MSSLFLNSDFPASFDSLTEWRDWLHSHGSRPDRFVSAIADLGILGMLTEKMSKRPWKGDLHRSDVVEESGLRGKSEVHDQMLDEEQYFPRSIRWMFLRYKPESAALKTWRRQLNTVAEKTNPPVHQIESLADSFFRSQSEDLVLAVKWMLVEYRRYAEDGPESFTVWFREKWHDLVELFEGAGHEEIEVSPSIRDFLVAFVAPAAAGRVLIRTSANTRMVIAFLRALNEGQIEMEYSSVREFVLELTGWSSPNAAQATLLAFGGGIPLGLQTRMSETKGLGRFDWIVAIPQVGRRVDFDKEWFLKPEWKPIKTKRSEQLEFQECLAQLAPGGRAIVLMPKSFCHGQGRERLIRGLTLDHFEVPAVVNLATSEGFKGTKLLTSLIFVSAPEEASRMGTLILQQGLFGWMADLDPDVSTFSPGELIFYSLLRSQFQLQRGNEGLPSISEVRRHFEDPSYQKSDLTDVTRRELEVLLQMCEWIGDGKNLVDSGSAIDWNRIPHSCCIDDRRIRENRLEWTARSMTDGGSGHEAVLSELVARFPYLSLTKLGDVAHLARGTRIPREQVIQAGRAEGDKDACVRLVRPSDIPKTQVTEMGLPPLVKIPKTLLLQDAVVGLSSEGFLKKGDILMVAEGDVGRCSLFSGTDGGNDNGGTQFIASAGVVVIRSSDGAGRYLHVPGSFLLAQLRSSLAAEWVKNNARGSTVSFVSVDRLREMPVLALNLLAVKEQLDGEVDPPDYFSKVFNDLDALSEHILAGHSLESLSVVLDESLILDQSIQLFRRDRLWSAFENGEGLPSPEQALIDMRTFHGKRVEQCRRSGDDAEVTGVLSGWWSACDDLISVVETIIGVRDEGDRALAASVFLGGWKKTLVRFSTEAAKLSSWDRDSTMPVSRGEIVDSVRSRAQRFLEAIQSILEATLEKTISNVEVSLEMEWINSVPHAVACNKGPITLLDVTLSVGEMENCAAQFGQGEKLVIPLSSPSGPVNLKWSGKRLDLQPVEGERSVVLTNSESTSLSVGPNPYVDARTLQNEEDRVFFGRQPEIQRILAELEKPSASTVLLIEGNRRTGKTSLVHHFTRHYLPSDWVAAYCTFQSGEGSLDDDGSAGRGVPTREIFFILAKAVLEGVVKAGVTVTLEDVGTFEAGMRHVLLFMRVSESLGAYFETGRPYERFRIVLEQCLEALGNRRLLLIIDEFDRLQEGIDSGVTSDQVPENIRHLFQTYNQIAGILTGSRKIRRLREQYWNVLFGIGDPLILRGLEPEAVRELIAKPVEGRITYARDAMARLEYLTAGQPRIIQTLCSRLFDLCKARNERLVSLAMVNEVAEEKAKDYEHFKVLWAAVNDSLDKLVAMTINRMKLDGVPVTFPLVQDALMEVKIRVTEKRLDQALDNLQDLEVVGAQIRESTKEYFIEIPLLSAWLLQNVDSDRLRDEVQDQLD